jgi:trk system potassium uptake protein TrkA
MRIIVIGCGRMGSGLARTMSLRGHAVTVVDRDPVAFERLGPAFKGQTVVGIGFDREVLLKAGIDRADALAALTESDEANVVAARLASQVFHIPRVVARLYDPRKADIYKRLGLRTIAPVAWGITRAADLLSRSQLEPVANLGGDVEIVEVEVPPLLVGRTVNELVVPGEIHVVAVSRGGRTLLPTLGTLFRDGDMVYVAVLSTSADRLSELLGLA